MSHSAGQVLDASGAIAGHFEYNGTVDVARSQIFWTAEARDASWRQDQPAPCTCVGLDVTLVTEAWPEPWEAKACFTHG